MTTNNTHTDWDTTESGVTPDLFGGELFGDELMDIYHSADVGHEIMDSSKF